ncbi:MAG TPA: glycerol-3-phosphate acyltransferase [Phototrophicaceae bacterium]|nr:glycerol-3-phosphate acyltransferase [Phototrophicaceae bacterium]
MSSELARVLLIVVVSYLLGSIPTAYLVGRLRHINIFEIGSGNMGATNVIRATGGIGWGALVWFFDSTKGIIAMLLAGKIMPENVVAAWVLAGIVVVIGHNWSLFATLITGTIRGGKGAATAFGTLLLILPLQLIAVLLVICGILIALTRYVSLAVLVMFGLAAVWLLLMISQHVIPFDYLFYTLGITALILIRFRENIQRILAGTERRFGERT